MSIRFSQRAYTASHPVIVALCHAHLHWRCMELGQKTYLISTISSWATAPPATTTCGSCGTTSLTIDGYFFFGNMDASNAVYPIVNWLTVIGALSTLMFSGPIHFNNGTLRLRLKCSTSYTTSICLTVCEAAKQCNDKVEEWVSLNMDPFKTLASSERMSTVTFPLSVCNQTASFPTAQKFGSGYGVQWLGSQVANFHAHVVRHRSPCYSIQSSARQYF